MYTTLSVYMMFLTVDETGRNTRHNRHLEDVPLDESEEDLMSETRQLSRKRLSLQERRGWTEGASINETPLVTSGSSSHGIIVCKRVLPDGAPLIAAFSRTDNSVQTDEELLENYIPSLRKRKLHTKFEEEER